MSSIYDVIIVGAGPAGSTAAYFLGQAGRRVLVLEKEMLPRYKTCGGGLSARFLETQFPFSFDAVIEANVTTMTYDFDGYSFTMPAHEGGMRMVMRDRFDAYILAHAQAEIRQGVRVRQVLEMQDSVIVETDGGDIVAGRYLIGADGANSMVARSVGLRRRKTMAAAIEAEVHVSPDVWRCYAAGPVFVFGEIRLGYLWIFPKANHLSVGIAALHPKPGELQATLRQVMARYRISLDNVHLHGHPIPLYTRREPIATARTLLVGDAAGLVDPFSGEGIRLAIKSGRLAAEAILAKRPQRYAGMVYRRIGFNHLVGLGVAWLFYNLEEICLAFGAPNPYTTRALMDLISDRAGYLEVMLRAIGTLPVFALTQVANAFTSLFRRFRHGSRIQTETCSESHGSI